MKRISLLILSAFIALAVAPVRGEDATQQQIDKLSGSIQDLAATIQKQNEKIDALEKEISELREKVNTPPPPQKDTASNEDLKNLAEKVKEIDQKRQADRELILDEIKKISKAVSASGGSGTTHSHSTTGGGGTPSGTSNGGGDTGTGPATPTKGYEYVVKNGDTLAKIAKAYRDNNVKVSTKQILDANPGLDANKLIVGKKIFIPDPNAK